jgi:hypothetical protein
MKPKVVIEYLAPFCNLESRVWFSRAWISSVFFYSFLEYKLLLSFHLQLILLWVAAFQKDPHKYLVISCVGWYTRRKWRVLVPMIGFISTFVTISLNHIQVQCYRWFTHTHTGPLLVPQLKHRNYNSLTESHIPYITHEWSLLITTLSLHRQTNLPLLPRTQNWTVVPFVSKITPLQRPHGKLLYFRAFARRWPHRKNSFPSIVAYTRVYEAVAGQRFDQIR